MGPLMLTQSENALKCCFKHLKVDGRTCDVFFSHASPPKFRNISCVMDHEPCELEQGPIFREVCPTLPEALRTFQ